MRKIGLMSALVGLLVAGVAQAAIIQIGVQATAYALNGNGGAGVPSPSLTVAIVDKDRNGIGAVTGADPNTFVWESGDWRIFGKVDGGAAADWADATIEGGVAGNYNYLNSHTYTFDTDTTLTGNDYVDPGDPVYLVYFPGLAATATKPGPNQWFGVIELGAIPTSGNLTFYNEEMSVSAGLKTAPEPATMALMLAGGGLMMALRRRRSR